MLHLLFLVSVVLIWTTWHLVVREQACKLDPTCHQKQKVDQLNEVYELPTNTRSSQGEYQVYIFEDNEAVIKMIIKGQSPGWDMCRELTELLLTGCLTESSWNQRFKSNKYVNTKNQLADILTKGSFSRDKWNHLLCLFNIMSFSTYSGSHLRSFLSQARERFVIGAMSQRGQDTTSSDESPVAKARPTNLVMHGHWKEDVSPQRSGSLVNPGNVNNRKGVGLATGNWGSSGSNFEVESSQMYRQEKVNLATRKLGQKDLTQPESEEDSSGTRKPDAVSPEMENMRFWSSLHGKDIPMHTEETGNNFSKCYVLSDSHKTNALTWRMSMASSMQAAIHLGPDSLENSEICKNTRFENIENVFNITQNFFERTFWRNSECEKPGLFITIMDEINTVKRQSDQVGEGKNLSTQIPFYALVGWNTNQEPQKKDGKDNMKISRSIPHTKTQLDSTEKQLNSSGQISQDLRHWLRRTSSRRTPRTGSSSCTCSMTFCGNQMIRIASQTLRKSRITRRDSNHDIGLFWVEGRKRDGAVTLTLDSGTVQPTKWYSNSKKVVILFS